MEESPPLGQGGGQEWVGGEVPQVPSVRAGSWEGWWRGRGAQQWEVWLPPPPMRPGGQLGQLPPVLGPHRCRKDPVQLLPKGKRCIRVSASDMGLGLGRGTFPVLTSE